MSKFVTYAITVRPRGGVTNKIIESFTKYFVKKSTYSFVITEGEGDSRHIHSAFVFKVPIARNNVCTDLIRVVGKGFAADEKVVLRNGVKILYSNDFITKYMKKDKDAVVIHRNLPEIGMLEKFYPVKEEKAPSNLYMHSTMYKYERLWREHREPHVEILTSTVRDFLHELQYKSRVIGLLSDAQVIQHAKWFTRWMHKVDTADFQMPPFEKEEGPGFH